MYLCLSFCQTVSLIKQYWNQRKSVFFKIFNWRIGDIKGTCHARMGMVKAEMVRSWQKQKRLRRGDKNTQKNYSKGLNDLDNHGGVVTHLEPDILECEVKWVLGSITTNKASGGNGIPSELFQILKDNAVKVLTLHSVCQQICKTQQ